MWSGLAIAAGRFPNPPLRPRSTHPPCWSLSPSSPLCVRFSPVPAAPFPLPASALPRPTPSHPPPPHLTRGGSCGPVPPAHRRGARHLRTDARLRPPLPPPGSAAVLPACWCCCGRGCWALGVDLHCFGDMCGGVSALAFITRCLVVSLLGVTNWFCRGDCHPPPRQ